MRSAGGLLTLRSGVSTLAVVFLTLACAEPEPQSTPAALGASGPPSFEPDTTWSPSFPTTWALRLGTDVYVDQGGHVWVLHRPELIPPEELEGDEEGCCIPAPPLIELDGEGRVVQALGAINSPEEWPPLAHSVFVDHQDFVWVATTEHHQVVKFTRDGRRVFTIGEFDEPGSNDDPYRLGSPADVYVDPGTNEVYVADGYQNQRVVVYDGATGEYVRHWGAYGIGSEEALRAQVGGEGLPATFNIVHGITGSSDGLLYVADRSNSRVQVFRRSGEFVDERILRSGSGGAFDVALSSDRAQEFLYVADGTEHRIWILRRQDLEVLGYFGSEGTDPGQVTRPHKLDTDVHGNIYVAESTPGRRVQRFLLKGVAP